MLSSTSSSRVLLTDSASSASSVPSTSVFAGLAETSRSVEFCPSPTPTLVDRPSWSTGAGVGVSSCVSGVAYTRRGLRLAPYLRLMGEVELDLMAAF